MKNIPERIYLNLGEETADDFRDLSEITWSEDIVTNNDVEYVRKSQWVSVEERLPEVDNHVLVYVPAIFPQLARHEVAYYDGEDWYAQDGEHIRPTHWCDIPPLNPEKEER